MSAPDLMLEQRIDQARTWLHEMLGVPGESGRVRLVLLGLDERGERNAWNELVPGFRYDSGRFAGLVADHAEMLDALASSVVTSADDGNDVFACAYPHASAWPGCATWGPSRPRRAASTTTGRRTATPSPGWTGR